ncbi:GDSL-type esterase/lipase family protein [Cohnella suwonensis]|uniref:GDSL-type esterase/lipase family protein n=1 Tax=Cohnella suwonensis TaxID=696072 RepID=A0ABW0LVZ4_9BACL
MIHYAAIGDSLTSGVGDLFGGGFVPKYANIMRHRLQREVVYDNLGMSGARSDKILAVIRSDYGVRTTLRNADVITITAGGNDLVDAAKGYGNSDAYRQALAKSRHNIAAMLEAIRQLKVGQRDYLIRLVDLYNPSPAMPESSVWIRRFNAQLDNLQDATVRVANIYDAFSGRERELLFFDRFHPNSRGYAVIADALDRLGYGPLG